MAGSRNRVFILALAMVGWAPARAEPQPPAAQPVTVTIDGSRRSDPVTRYEYGMFIEPIGNLVARSLWAEMLDDRKFYFPIVSESKDTPPPLTVVKTGICCSA